MKEFLKIIVFLIVVIAIFWLVTVYIQWVSHADLPLWFKIFALS